MKNRKKLCIVVAFAVATAAFSGCGMFKNKGVESNVPASQFGQSSQAVRSDSASSTQSQPENSGSSKGIAPNEPTESQPGQVIDIETDNKDFDKRFKANPIDKKYIQESNKAFSNVEMVQLSNKYADIWSKEVTSAYNKLVKLASGGELSKFKSEQAAWTNGKSDALKKISDAAQAAGGTMAQVNEASAVMDYYRSRAAQVYKELYAYDKNFTYAFNNQ